MSNEDYNLEGEVIARWAREGARHGECGRMCDDCAFKVGTEANSDPYVASMAAQCVAYDTSQFACHHQKDGKFFQKNEEDGKPKLCAGYLYAKQFFKSKYK